MSKNIFCLDAGHYGKYNRSPAVPAYYESEAMWKLHLLLKAELENYGFEVVLTRADQTKDMELFARGAASKGAALFLSLHSNAVGSGVNENTDYPAVYHLTDDAGTTVDDVSKELAELLTMAISLCMGTKQGGRALSRLAKTDKNKDGVINDNYYGVLNGARQVGTPGLILEHSFHTNTRSANWLMDDANLRKLAEAEAIVIANYFAKVEETPSAEINNTKEGYEMNMRTLYKGCKGEDVRAMQQLLTLRGVACNPDGSFGPATEKAVRKYQQKKNLQVDGRCGPATMSSLLGVS